MVISTLVNINGEIGDGKKFWLRTWVKQIGEVRATGRRHRKMARCRPRLEPRILIEIFTENNSFSHEAEKQSSKTLACLDYIGMPAIDAFH